MSIWGKVLGGVAGFAMGGPFGAVMGAAFGHAADQGVRPAFLPPHKLAALLGQKEQLFSIAVVTLAAKLCKADGPVVRAEIDAFKRQFRVPPDAARDVGRLFDEARNSSDGYADVARSLGEAFADNRLVLEDVMAALFAIARADKPVTQGELLFLQRVHTQFGLDAQSWERAATGRAAPRVSSSEPDPYSILGVPPSATGDQIRAAWKQLMRDNHPDTLASKGVPPDFVQRASDKVARINAAWDRVKRDRGL